MIDTWKIENVRPAMRTNCHPTIFFVGLGNGEGIVLQWMIQSWGGMDPL